MVSWDCYCAICGGPLRGVTDRISEKPRSAEFLKKWAQEMEDQRMGKESAPREAHDTENDTELDSDDDAEDEDDEVDSDDLYDEEICYDRDVVSVEDVQWIEALHVLGYNSDSVRETKLAVPVGDGNSQQTGSRFTISH
jgi:hypothetical protein